MTFPLHLSLGGAGDLSFWKERSPAYIPSKPRARSVITVDDQKSVLLGVIYRLTGAASRASVIKADARTAVGDHPIISIPHTAVVIGVGHIENGIGLAHDIPISQHHVAWPEFALIPTRNHKVQLDFGMELPQAKDTACGQQVKAQGHSVFKPIDTKLKAL